MRAAARIVAACLALYAPRVAVAGSLELDDSARCGAIDLSAFLWMLELELGESFEPSLELGCEVRRVTLVVRGAEGEPELVREVEVESGRGGVRRV